jgi:hypothetical protein
VDRNFYEKMLNLPADLEAISLQNPEGNYRIAFPLAFQQQKWKTGTQLTRVSSYQLI